MEVVLHGRSPDKLDVVAKAFRRVVAGADPAIAVQATGSLTVALEGADVVLNQVRIGGYAARIFDETFPRAFGLPGEETMGPGGFANAVRTVPALRSTWDAISRTVPPATLVINLTNPAGIVVGAAAREFGLRVVGVCDSPITLLEQVADRIERPFATVARRYMGGNHCGWWVPDEPSDLETVASLGAGLTTDEVVALGALPAPYNRYYLVPDRMLSAQLAKPTRGAELVELEARLLERYTSSGASRRDEALTDTPAGPKRGAVWYAKAVVPLLDRWWNGMPGPIVVGLPTSHGPAGLPNGAILEGLVAVGVGSLTTQPWPVLPPLPGSLLAAHATYETMTVDALASGSSRRSLVAALAANPMVRDLDRAAALLDAITAGSPNG